MGKTSTTAQEWAGHTVFHTGVMEVPTRGLSVHLGPDLSVICQSHICVAKARTPPKSRSIWILDKATCVTANTRRTVAPLLFNAVDRAIQAWSL
mmetsp:Transcript_9579/g.22007  ORF Transcript_9579/g.22007 Transcript_9579/m.22007 type:complete len:94 (+) Transcript_9579:605-886(+)